MRGSFRMKTGIWASLGLVICILALAEFVSGCGSGSGTSSMQATTNQQRPGRSNVQARLHPLAGSGASGTAVFKKSSGQYSVTLTVAGLKPTRGAQQYAFWQLKTPRDRVALQTAEEILLLATYRVGTSGRLAVEFEPPIRDYEAVPGEKLGHFLVTLIESPEAQQNSTVEFDETGKPPDLGEPIAEGALSGPLPGGA